MTKSPPSRPCVLFALRRESLFFRKTFRPRKRVDAPCWASICESPAATVLLLETSVGQPRVEWALDWLLARPTADRPSRLLFAGFAGSLSPEMRVGDVLIAADVVDGRGQRWPTTWPDSRQGRLLTADRLIATAAEKREFGERYMAQAVDMESAAFARRCVAAGLPFACVRAISDDVDTPLSPELVPLLAGGTVSPWRVAATLARHPGLLPELLRLARHTKHAARQLGAVVAELVTS